MTDGLDVLLIQPNYQQVKGAWGINPPLGLAYIASLLEHNNFTVEILDANALHLTETQTINTHFHQSRPGTRRSLAG